MPSALVRRLFEKNAVVFFLKQAPRLLSTFRKKPDRIHIRYDIVDPAHRGLLPMTRIAAGQKAASCLFQGESQDTPLAPFFDSLTGCLLKKKQRPVKVLLFGDSTVGGDFFPGHLRRRLQSFFGNGGPGFFCLGRPHDFYILNAVEIDAQGPWTIQKLTDVKLRDRYLGLNGYAFTAWPGAEATIVRRTYFDRMHVYFLRQPGGGRFQVVDDAAETPETKAASLSAEADTAGRLSTVDTSAEFPSNAIYSIPFGSRKKIRLLNSSPNEVRFYGIDCTRGSGGLILSAFPVLSGSAAAMLRISRSQWQGQLGMMAPDLGIVMFGMNIIAMPEYSMVEYRKILDSFIRRIVDACGKKTVIFVGPMGRPETKDGERQVIPVMRKVMALQKTACLNAGCVYFDMFGAVGGDAALNEWYGPGPGGPESRLMSADTVHFTVSGAARAGDTFFTALMTAYRDYLTARGLLKITRFSLTAKGRFKE